MQDYWIPITSFVMVPLAIIACNAPYLIEKWVKGRAAEQLILLKLSMVQRGMSAEEIERVIAAGVPSGQENEVEEPMAARREKRDLKAGL